MITNMRGHVKVLISIVTFIFIATFIVVAIIYLVNFINNHRNNDGGYKPTNISEKDFSLSVFKRTSANTSSNFLVSPYSMSVALNMLKDGAEGDTKAQIENALRGTNTKPLDNDSVHIANAIFIKEEHKDQIKKSYIDLLGDNYKADYIYDKFNTPDVINKWVNKETDGMIPSILDDISKDFVLGLANAIAIDVKWANQFECLNTRKEEFNTPNGKMDVEMMHQQYSYDVASYISSEKANGVILQYEKDTNLEYVAIMPDGDIDEYIKDLTIEELSELDSSRIDADRNTNIHLSIPRYSYTFDYRSFKDM